MYRVTYNPVQRLNKEKLTSHSILQGNQSHFSKIQAKYSYLFFFKFVKMYFINLKERYPKMLSKYTCSFQGVLKLRKNDL